MIFDLGYSTENAATVGRDLKYILPLMTLILSSHPHDFLKRQGRSWM